MDPREKVLREFMLCGIGGALLAVLLILVVFATGSTFGQRCAAAHPGDEAAQSACVERLASGK